MQLARPASPAQFSPATGDVVDELGLRLTDRRAIVTDADKMTSRPGDAALGQSLIVTAIAEGGQVTACVDRYLMGRTQSL